MKDLRPVLTWIGAGLLAALVLVWAFPRAYPLFPKDWEISKREAQIIGLERLRDLGDLPQSPYIVTRLDEAGALEQRIQNHLGSLDREKWTDSELVKTLLTWEVAVWESGTRAQEWSHHARITPDGEVMELLIRLPSDQESGGISAPQARQMADQFLQEQGIDLAGYDEPEVRTRDLQSRTDLFLRYRNQEALLGQEYPYGVEVVFAGSRLAGYSRYFDDPELIAIRQSFQPIQLLVQAKVFLPLVLLPLIAVPFVRRAHP